MLASAYFSRKKNHPCDTLIFVFRLYRWKIYESTMLALGSVCKMIILHFEEKKLPFDITAFLQNVVLSCLGQDGEKFFTAIIQKKFQTI